MDYTGDDFALFPPGPGVAPARAPDDAPAHGLCGDALGGARGDASGSTSAGAFPEASHGAVLGGVLVPDETTPENRRDDNGCSQEVAAAWPPVVHPHASAL